MKETCLVIGGNGFIGSHLIDHLLETGYKVRVYDVQHEKFRRQNPNVRYYISPQNNIHDLYEALIGADIVFHLASASVPSTSGIDFITDIEKNLIFSLNVFNACVKNNIKKIVYFSSGGAVYGIPETLPIKESHSRIPISSYGILKATIENYLNLFSRTQDIETLVVRPSNPYGPRQGHFAAQGVISTFLYNACTNQTLKIFGSGDSKKDYIYIDDLISQVVELIKKGACGCFNIGSGEGFSLNEIANLVEKITDERVDKKYENQKSYDVTDFVLDISKLKTELGSDIKFTPLLDGMQHTKEWIVKYRINENSNTRN